MDGRDALLDRRAIPGLVIALLGMFGLAYGIRNFTPQVEGPGILYAYGILALAAVSVVGMIGGFVAAVRHQVSIPLTVEAVVVGTTLVGWGLFVVVHELPTFPVFWPSVVLVLAANVVAVVATRRRVVPWFQCTDSS